MSVASATWRAIARWAPGPRHLRAGVPCQDRAAYRVRGEWLFGAVADGAGTATRSDEGAAIAVEFALASLETAFTGQAKTRPPSRAELERTFRAAHASVREHLASHAWLERAQVEDFSTTLLALVATPHWTAAMQVGDGFAVIRDVQGAYHLLCGPDRGEYLNVTIFVADEGSEQRLQIRVVERAPAFICASTDGLERLCLQGGREPHPGFFDPLARFVEETPEPEANDGYITGFLSSPRLDARSDDDRTLLLASLLAP